MKIVIFHFNPIEKYPPIMNLIRVLEKNVTKNSKIVIFTTKGCNKTEQFETNNAKIIIHRIGLNIIPMNVFRRYFNYLYYFVKSFLNCLIEAPDKLFYFESMSALVPCYIKKYIFKKTELFIHYHEYMTVQDYNGMYLSRLFHRLEKRVYNSATWISQTNTDRVRFFLEDIDSPELGNIYVYPNYPLNEWGLTKNLEQIKVPVRLVYVGSFGSMESIYIAETLEWIKAQDGKLTLDIYSFNIPENIIAYINNLKCSAIRILGQVNYYKLPAILINYDVGLILYKAKSKNFEFNAPNKLFEYLACGLDVWYPKEMKGIWEYDSQSNCPKVLRLNFEKLNEYSVETLVCRQSVKKRTISYTCEEASKGLVAKLLN